MHEYDNSPSVFDDEMELIESKRLDRNEAIRLIGLIEELKNSADLVAFTQEYALEQFNKQSAIILDQLLTTVGKLTVEIELSDRKLKI